MTASIAGLVIFNQASQSRTSSPFVLPPLSLPGIGAGVSRVPGADEVESTERFVLVDQNAEASGQDTLALVRVATDTAAATPLAEPSLTDSMAAAPLARASGETEVASTYEVQPGDTSTSIAGQFGIAVGSIIYNNPEIADPDVLIVGQQIVIPAQDGIIHWVRLGETVRTIARMYDVTPEAIIAFTGNGLSTADDLSPGIRILVPGGTPNLVHPALVERPALEPADDVTPAPTETPSPTPTETPTLEPSDTPPPTETQRPQPTPKPTKPPKSSFGFAWPVYGPISSYFGPGHPLGIDIDLYGRDGAAIGASAGGRVIFAGGDPCCSYGLYVIIQHSDGFTTLYGHLSGLAVEVGQRVQAGATIGFGGSTGYSTGTHLHFEIRKNNVPLDPLEYLP